MACRSNRPSRETLFVTWKSSEIDFLHEDPALRPRYVYFLLSFSLIGIVVLGLFGAYRCLRVATVIGRGTGTQASEALATLPIQFITSDDLAAAVAAAGASINADSNHLPVPMLSVQSPGCAGMERLGVPARSSIGSPPLRDERNRRLRVDSGTSGAAAANSNSSTIYQHHPNVHSHHSHHSAVGNSSSSTSSNFMSIHNHHAQFHQATTTTSRTTAQKDTGSSGGGSSSNSYLKAASTGSSSTSSSFYGTINNNSNNLCSASTISRCPHHVALPDGERGPDRDLQIRSSSQQSEIPRTYVKAPPNKTVRDVPVQHQHHHPSSSVGGIGSSVSSSASSSMNNLTSQHARFGGSGSGISLGNRALVNSMSTIGSSQAAAAAAKSDKQKKTILWFLADVLLLLRRQPLCPSDESCDDSSDSARKVPLQDVGVCHRRRRPRLGGCHAVALECDDRL
ncbi:hypothetical protein pipiens_006858 [Culex pipiens pipiens]|uniref:Uncharacterized protein n=1 Tax=Culex pipiens pipiens TaxID=38569 RepID=A0ABD1DNH1_CULPP